MAIVTPLLRSLQQAEASLLQYGPAVEAPGAEARGIYLVETFGELELEYASLRKHCVLIDAPHRGTIDVTGPDRVDFLNRMLTQELKGLAPGEVRRSFWLNRKGRIDADLRVIALPDRVMLDVDAHAAARTLEGLSSYIITEDCAARDRTEELHRLWLIGPTAWDLLGALLTPAGGQTPAAPAPDHALAALIAGASVVIDREDATGVPGYAVTCAVGDVQTVYSALIEAGHDASHGAHDHAPGSALAAKLSPASETLGSRVRLRPAGWHAYNVARIEHGTPLFNLDFTTENLPAETGLLRERVSFTKGCYLGQEIVARMNALGKPKQVLVGLRMDEAPSSPTPGEFPEVPQPVTGAQVHVPPGEGQSLTDAVGAVTSSTISPLLGARAICFAQVKYAYTPAGTKLIAAAEDGYVPATVQPSLRFVPSLA